MTLDNRLRQWLEEEEQATVSDAFGGTKTRDRKAYSVSKIRNQLLSQTFSAETPGLEADLAHAKQSLPPQLFRLSIENLLRFSFLIELTNLTIGSTKMKTRWLPGFILMSHSESYEPVKGRFIYGNDPRAASFDACLAIFRSCLLKVIDQYNADTSIESALMSLDKFNSVPYEFPFDYTDPRATHVHAECNVAWVFNEDIRWLLQVRPVMLQILDKTLVNKIRTKTYKTDRALTGKDKTNRAKRWEVLAGDFQHASLIECWSVERRLLEDLTAFNGFPPNVRHTLVHQGLINAASPPTRCPITLDPLTFDRFGVDPVHGRAEYQIGHLNPLKRGGRHNGVNVRWQSADGNRIQGDLTINETVLLLDRITEQRDALSIA
jgi:hypothetical protein